MTVKARKMGRVRERSVEEQLKDKVTDAIFQLDAYYQESTTRKTRKYVNGVFTGLEQ